MLCAGCGKGDATLWCAKCKQVYYCDKKCQKTHWKLIHRETCGEAGAADASHIPAIHHANLLTVDYLLRDNLSFYKKINEETNAEIAKINEEMAADAPGLKASVDASMARASARNKYEAEELLGKAAVGRGSSSAAANDANSLFDTKRLFAISASEDPPDWVKDNDSLCEHFLSLPRWSPEATDGKVPMLQMKEFQQILTNHCIRRGSASNVTKTLDQLWDGLGLAEYAGSTGSKEQKAEWDDMPAASQKKAFGRLKHLLESFHSGVSEEKQLAEIQRMASCYPPCCYPPCRKRSIFRCETCLSDTEKYCSQKCQLADYSRHMQTCVSYTVGAATRASKEGVGN